MGSGEGEREIREGTERDKGGDRGRGQREIREDQGADK